MEGDRLISSFTRRLWAIHQHVIMTWGVYTVFSYRSYDVPKGKEGILQWFIPDVPEKHAIDTWLDNELADIQTEPNEIPELDYKHPGERVHISIHEFSEIEPYVERDKFMKIAKNMMDKFLRGE